MLPPPLTPTPIPQPEFPMFTPPSDQKEKKSQGSVFRINLQHTEGRGGSRERKTPAVAWCGVEEREEVLVPMMRRVVRASEYRESPKPKETVV